VGGGGTYSLHKPHGVISGLVERVARNIDPISLHTTQCIVIKGGALR